MRILREHLQWLLDLVSGSPPSDSSLIKLRVEFIII